MRRFVSRSLVLVAFAAPIAAHATELVSLGRSGGFFAQDTELTIETDGSYVKDDLWGTCTGTLTPVQLNAARTLVRNTRRWTTASTHFPDNCCDFYTYSVSTSLGTTIFTPDGVSRLPMQIEAAAGTIDDLIGATCSTSSSSS